MSSNLKNNLLTLIYFLLILLVCFIVKWVWESLLIRITGRRKLDNKILKKSLKGVIFFVFFSGLNILWERITIFVTPRTKGIEKIFLNVPKIIYSFIVLSVCFIVSGIVDGFVEWYLEEIANRTKTKVDEEFMNLFQRISKIIIFFIGITIILNRFNQPITSILGAAGIASFAIAFAAQDTLSNMISGFFIIIDKPFKIGDRIKLATGETGEVVEIGMRRTKILSPENNIVVVSNSEIAKTRIVNFGFPDTKIKIKLKIGIQLEKGEIEKVKGILKNICQNNPLIIGDIEIYLTEYANSQVIFSLIFKIDYNNEMEVIDGIINEIRRRFLEEKFNLLFVRRE